MPAASNKTEPKPSNEATDPVKLILSQIDKKVRNLEKRKSKLDIIRAKQSAGETLEKEQKDALKAYESVIASLECFNDMQKSVNVVASETEKLLKKQAKREKMEKAASEVKKFSDVLMVQTTLDALGSDIAREHFKTGKHGAVVLTDDNLTSLDELYRVISPARSEDDTKESFAAKLNTSAEHLLGLVESRDKAVCNSTYKELMETLQYVNNCGYFETIAKEAKEEATEETEEVEAEVQKEEESPSPVEPSSLPAESAPSQPLEAELSLPQSASDLEENTLAHSQVLQTSVAAESSNTSFFTASQQQVAAPVPQYAPPQPTPHRDLGEILSNVAGSFNFLQDSEIEESSPLMGDSAVIMAQPMLPNCAPTAQNKSMMASAYQPAQSLVVDQSPLDQSEAAQDPLSLSQQSLSQSNLDYSGASQTAFAQAGLSHSQNLTQGVVSAAAAEALYNDEKSSQQHGAHNMMGQSRGAGDSSAQFDLPPQIPMPPSQPQQDQSSQEKKFSTLNASATEFQSQFQGRSMYPNMPPNMQQQGPAQPHQDPRQPAPHNNDFSSANNFAQAAGDFSQAANNFQNQGFQRGGRGAPAGGNNFRGGNPRGPRGGNNNTNAMQNGFNQRPQNGNNAGRPNNRGGAASSFQGYPPRNDYRPEGYQGGYNGNGFNTPYTKGGRGGGPSSFNNPRGGNNARGAGGMRSGAPRGNQMPRGVPQGPGGAPANRGGLTRPVNQ